MAALAVPFALFEFGALVQWSGLLGVIAQIIQGIIFIVLRVKSSKKEGEESTLASATEAIAGEPVIGDDKFVIGGGWVGAAFALTGLFGASGLLCYVSGWRPMVAAVVLVVGMFVLKGIEIGVLWIIGKCRAGREEIGKRQGLTESLLH
jgi:hypothetical protein